MLNIMSYIFFALFILSLIIHLIFCFKENEKARAITKPIPLFFLTLAALVTLPSHPLIYIGALLGMGGDILLVRNKDKRYFIGGAILFLLGHFLYIGEILFILLKATPMPTLFYILVPIALVIIVIVALPLTKKIVKNTAIAIVGPLYMAILVLVTAISLVALIKGHNLIILAVIGGVSFFVSDVILTQATFIKDFKRRDFYIMLTYLLGQILIVSGLIFSAIM